MRPGPVKVSPNVEAKNTVPSRAPPDTTPLWKMKAATKVVIALKNAAGRASKPSASRIPPKNSESTAHHAKKIGKGKPILATSAMNQSCGPHRPSRGKTSRTLCRERFPSQDESAKFRGQSRRNADRENQDQRIVSVSFVGILRGNAELAILRHCAGKHILNVPYLWQVELLGGE